VVVVDMRVSFKSGNLVTDADRLLRDGAIVRSTP
jgi:hypothetical protein